MRRPILLALLVALAWPNGAEAASFLTLRDALTMAQGNPELRAAAKQVKAALARVHQANLPFNPNLTFSADDMRPTDLGRGNYQIGVSLPLLPAGQRTLRTKAAELEHAIAELERQNLSRNLATAVSSTYAEILRSQANAELAAQSVEWARRLLQSAESRYKAGDVSRYETIRAQVELTRAEKDRAVAGNAVAQAKARLNVLLGRSAQIAFDVQDGPPDDQLSLPALDTLVEQALANRLELQLAAIAGNREVILARLASAEIWTGTEVSLATGVAEGDHVVSASASLPIPLWNLQQGAVAEAQANEERFEAQRDQWRNTITLEVEAAYRDTAIATDQLKLFQTSLLPQADRLINLAQRRFQEGEGSGLEVLEARRTYQETHTAYVQSLLDYRIAIANLEKAVATPLSKERK